MYEDYPSLFQTRLDCLNHLFFVIGNGYSWQDGEIVCHSGRPDEREKAYRAKRKAEDEARWLARLKELDERIAAGENLQEYRDDVAADKWWEDPPVGPVPDDGQDYAFYSVCEYSLINQVPTNATAEWLELAREAAEALATRCCPRKQPEPYFQGTEEDQLRLDAMWSEVGGKPPRTIEQIREDNAKWQANCERERLNAEQTSVRNRERGRRLVERLRFC